MLHAETPSDVNIPPGTFTEFDGFSAEMKPLAGKTSAKRGWRARALYASTSSSHGGLTFPQWVFLMVFFTWAGQSMSTRPAPHLIVPQHLPGESNATVPVQRSFRKKITTEHPSFPEAVFQTKFRAYLEDDGVPREAALAAFNAYVGPKGGLSEHELLNWLKFCHEPPENEKEDLDETFSEIDTSHSQYVSFKDLEKEMEVRKKDSGVKGCVH